MADNNRAMVDFSVTFLGTGTSVGVPVIGCGCEVCRSENPKNNRTRASVWVKAGGFSLLVDSGPDLRLQALRENMSVVDAVLYTHPHMDHVVGFDDLRAFCWRREEPLPLHATAPCMAHLKRMFGWAFSEENKYPGYIKPAERIIDGPFRYGDLKVTPLPVIHASVDTTGYLFEYPKAKRTAYIPDVKKIPETTMELLHEVDVLIVDALRPQAHPTHYSLGEALLLGEETKAKELWLTHLGHENDHDELSTKLPGNVRIAWDGLVLS